MKASQGKGGNGRKTGGGAGLSTADCACFNLRKTTRAVTQVYDAALRPTGLRTTQFSLLAVLKRYQPVAITELAGRMTMDRTTLTRNLKPLEKQGLLRILRGADSRVHELSLTDAGRAALEAALPLWASAQARMADMLGEKRLGQLLEDLAAVREAAGGIPPYG